ncbi:MAG: hypothetical protein JWQ11_2779, partial [Rhizobacter sp.]|nr:hypothetical protein [Rhizobacter sp.]
MTLACALSWSAAQAQSAADAARAEPNDAQQLQRQQERESALRRKVEEPPKDERPKAPATPQPRLPTAEAS